MNASGARKVPDGAPARSMPTRWRGYLEAAAKAGNVTAYRHYWELCVLLALHDELRSGDVRVPGSRRYAYPAAYLLTRPDGPGNGRSLAGWPANPPPTWRLLPWPTSCTRHWG